MLENGWEFSARKVYSHNSDAFSVEQVINISMACNHCSDPLCLTGCPTSAYHTDPETGAVIADHLKCIGCRYCTWNCPYDAPKFNSVSGIIEKCHLCNHLIITGDVPSCSSACPTGALGFGDIPDSIDFNASEIIPERGINPSYYFIERINGNHPEIIPYQPEKENPENRSSLKGSVSEQASLISFTFLSLISVSLTVSSVFSYKPSWYFLSLLSILLAGFSSLFHLTSRLKAWRSIANIGQSPLSREILALIIYGGLVVGTHFVDLVIFQIVVSLSGLLLLLLIDSVYIFTSGKITRFHSGQVFITSMLIVSFLTQQTVPFLFIAALKLFIIIQSGELTGKERTLFGLRFIRVALLVISILILVTGSGKGEPSSVVIFLSGELIDRYLFYYDFVPVNISHTINYKIKIS
jgi:Fe-S-cluster-containing dehydrogenase component/DMSO reductase anchor subunit